VFGLLASRVLAPVHRKIGIFIGKDHGRSVFVPFSDDVPDDGACEHLLQINLLAQSGQKGERIFYERDMAVVDDAIAKMKSEVKKNPKNESAKQVLYSSYQNKIDLLNSVSQKEELVASLK